MKDKIRHSGIITEWTEHGVAVQIIQQSACSSCHVRRLCQTSESKKMIITVPGHYPSLSVGAPVELEGNLHESRHAIVLAYAIPLALMVVVLLVAIDEVGEGWASLLSLSVLLIYYFILYLLRDRIGRRFSFTIIDK